jgi:hypothetical protein
LVYWARTLSWGGGAASGGAPLPLVMEVLSWSVFEGGGEVDSRIRT